ncbi:FtsW/RodA/SpoVE family cell cycle protein [Fructilactobacillus frigidiflavus]|uniref:FtsW/RodA/SpoVE family cell cycle protein n=1 Tax=Fructilactobacillus frigidiflavus TaxID=3242688 RepID=UPI00375787AA
MKKRSSIDWYLMVPYIILCLFGIVMVYSASAGIGLSFGQGEATMLAEKQTFYFLIGLVIIFCVNKFFFKFILSNRFVIYLFWGLLVALLYVKLLGKTINGAAGWISLGFFSLQPAEFCKFFFIIFFALILRKRQLNIENYGLGTSFKENFFPLFIPATILLLIAVQPDTGGAAINFMIVFAMLLGASRSGKTLRNWTGIVAFFIIAFYTASSFFADVGQHIHSYQVQRIVAFHNPFLHAQTSGAQLINSFYAISNGGLAGRGLGNSIQKMGYLPEANTDFIISIISEEFGLVGIIFVLGLLYFMIIQIIQIGRQTNNLQYSSICYGTAAYLTIQTLFNAGGAVALVPLTGVALPFISYGGSSMFTLSLCIALVLKISSIEKQEQLQK